MPSGIIQGTFGFIYMLASPAVDGSEAIKKKQFKHSNRLFTDINTCQVSSVPDD